ncbi:type II toxin-antitoxin system Phd/YefM family antitoxin [Aliiroseovarius sp. 2305UL8-7]|uniref:type II toxin-antitoxin system Phd/YefM family antitoxin n=1 Tax=Aliiroseovarius conchicola TaxID=3121637 RepID=UPI0035279D7A
MQVSVSEAKGQLTDLIRRAEAGDEVILTRHGKAIVRLAPVQTRPNARNRRALIDEIKARAADKVQPGVCAVDSQDFLYDDDGLPE